LKPRARVALAWALRLGLGGLLVFTGAAKLADPAAFAIEIHNYQLLPSFAPLLAVTLPATELVGGVAILAGTRPWLRAGALLSAGLMVVFTIAVSTVVARGINISCGCFGAGSGPVSVMTIARDVALVVASVVLLRVA
jgi:uncharacterized membrane protein YphA (DoxX/SURF4 family)